MTTMNVFAIGASRNIERGATVTFLLRNPGVFDTDEVIQKYISSGQAHLVKGDALNEGDVRAGWEKAQSERSVDAYKTLMVYTGGTPKLTVKGIVLSPQDICTLSLRILLHILPNTPPQPKLVVISSSGVTAASHERLPFIMKPLYSWLLAAPHADKLGLERVLARAMGRTWDEKTDGVVDKEILPDGWESTVESGGYKNMLVIRPAFLTDGASMAETIAKGKEPYRVGEGDLEGGNGYTISRKDVVHFITERALGDDQWNKWQSKIVTIAY